MSYSKDKDTKSFFKDLGKNKIEYNLECKDPGDFVKQINARYSTSNAKKGVKGTNNWYLRTFGMDMYCNSGKKAGDISSSRNPTADYQMTCNNGIKGVKMHWDAGNASASGLTHMKVVCDDNTEQGYDTGYGVDYIEYMCPKNQYIKQWLVSKNISDDTPYMGYKITATCDYKKDCTDPNNSFDAACKNFDGIKDQKIKYCATGSNILRSDCKEFCFSADSEGKCDAAVNKYCENNEFDTDICSCFVKNALHSAKAAADGTTQTIDEAFYSRTSPKCWSPNCIGGKGYLTKNMKDMDCPACIQLSNIGSITMMADAVANVNQSCTATINGESTTTKNSDKITETKKTNTLTTNTGGQTNPNSGSDSGKNNANNANNSAKNNNNLYLYIGIGIVVFIIILIIILLI